MQRVIGLDISSSNIGYSVLEYTDTSIKLITYGVIKPPKDSNILTRLIKTKFLILEILEKNQPDYIAIEDIIQFMKHKSSAKTVITLAVFNRMIGLVSYEFLNKPPTMLAVMTIRSLIRFKTKIVKEDIPNIIEQHLNIKFPWIMKTNKKTKLQEINVQSYDLADSIAVGLAFILKQRKNKKLAP